MLRNSLQVQFLNGGAVAVEDGGEERGVDVAAVGVLVLVGHSGDVFGRVGIGAVVVLQGGVVVSGWHDGMGHCECMNV